MDHTLSVEEQLAEALKLLNVVKLENEQEDKKFRELQLDNEQQDKKFKELQLDNEQQDKKIQKYDQTNRLTTLEELLEVGDALHRSLKVEQHESRQAKGGTRDPKGKVCPVRLQQWASCVEDLQDSYDALYKLLNPHQDSQNRLFMSRANLEGIRKTIPTQPIGNEPALTQFSCVAVESIIGHIITELAKNPSYKLPLRLKDNVYFDFNMNSLNDAAPDVAERQDILEAPIFADRICWARDNEDLLKSARLLHIVEQKAPHKLSLKLIRAGLRDMDLGEVIQNYKVSSDEKQRARDAAKTLVAAVLSQAYSYMLEGGLEFGIVETGELYVFLRVYPHDSNTLWCHLAVPGEDVHAVKEFDFAHPFSAIGQRLAFLLMTFKSQRQDQVWRKRATKCARLWEVDVDSLHAQIDADEKALGIKPDTVPETAFSPYRGPKHIVIRKSPYTLRYGKKRPSQCKEQADLRRDESDDDTDNQRESKRHEDTPTRQPPMAKERNNRRGNPSTRAPRLTDNKDMPFCTHKCLLGLKLGNDLDANCPNFHLHRNDSQGSSPKHRLKIDRFASRLVKQLAKSLDEGVTDLELQGARGRLFKITLLSRGYTFVAKGTRDVFILDLQHEARAYDRLLPLQGEFVPVCLGNIDLRDPWIDIGVRIIHMLLMSYAGKEVHNMYNYRKEQRMITQKMEELGVEHMDIRWPNILVDKATQRVMIIDFERSKLSAIAPTKRPLREITGNTSPTKGASSPTKKQPLQDQSGNVSPVKPMAKDLSSNGDFFHLLPDSNALDTLIE